MLIFAWFIALHLTQQRILLEASNKISILEKKISPYIWDFHNFKTEVVESFQQYWNYDKNNTSIKSTVTNPQLSLNFSGQRINTLLHDTLIIDSNTTLNGQLIIQLKTDLASPDYYYSEPIILEGHSIIIRLNRFWKLNNLKNKATKSWGKQIKQISSIVLQFSQVSKNITISSINIPYRDKTILSRKTVIDCKGKFDGKILKEEINIFNLRQTCLFPSTYMSLKQSLSQQFPESILNLESVKIWQRTSQHDVNKPYTNNFKINATLYSFILAYIIGIFCIRFRYSHYPSILVERSWYKVLGKKLIFKGARKAFLPYHLLSNYLVVLIPTLLLLILMTFIKFPQALTFKHFITYFLWAIFQQFVLGYILAERLFYNKTQNRLIASLCAAALFSILHMPSVTLMLVTFIAAGFWAYAWLIFKRLLPLAISHALLALMFYYIIPTHLLYSAKVLQWFWK